MSFMVGVDVGGTFTDISFYDTDKLQTYYHKLPSSPSNPSVSILEGLKSIFNEYPITPNNVSYLAHGTTVATNALIEKKGSRTALIVTKGFRDLLEIGWQKRPSLYNLFAKKAEPIVEPDLIVEVTERILFNGYIKTPLNDDEVLILCDYLRDRNVDSIAVCTLFSFVNPVHENRIKSIISDKLPNVYLSLSSEVCPEFREYSRLSTTMLNAYLGPIMKKYIVDFERNIKDLGVCVHPYVTQSNGSIISLSQTIDYPIRTAMSGPSAGIVSAVNVSKEIGLNRIITLDMGGTSADISLIENGYPKITNEKIVEGFPVHVPMLDIVTIGAGGGSIATIDSGGALQVGPQSAGAFPGPASYGNGGTSLTVTDVHIILGKLNNVSILGGKFPVSYSLAYDALKSNICDLSGLSAIEATKGVISVVNSNMIRAINLVSVERGYDVREFTLLAFGGAGPLHACELAQDIGIEKVVIPPSPGTFCSQGLLLADTIFNYSRTNILMADFSNIPKINAEFNELKAEANAFFDLEKIPKNKRKYMFSLDARYEFQNYELSLPLKSMPVSSHVLNLFIKQFHKKHEHEYGYHNLDYKIQIVNFKVSAIGDIVKPKNIPVSIDLTPDFPEDFTIRSVLFQDLPDYIDCKVINRESLLPGAQLLGPLVIEEMDSTIVIPTMWKAEVDGYRNLIINHIIKE